MGGDPRVLALPSLSINVTAVRVPVFFGHGLAVHATFERALTAAAAAAAFAKAPGIELIEAESTAEFPTPATLATAPDKVYAGRVRLDPTRERALNFGWLRIMFGNVRRITQFRWARFW